MPLANVLVETFLKGGPIMWPILVCLIVALATVGERLLFWRNVRRLRADKAFSEALWEVRLGQYGPAWQRTQSAPSPFLIALRSGLANGRTEPVTAMQLRAEETLEEAGARQWLLSTIITLAPLLGLLGTASGLVTIFQGLGETTDHLAIARGIAEALNTTIFGLAIAVPCVIAHSYFTRRIERLTARMESVLADFVSAYSHQTPPAN